MEYRSRLSVVVFPEMMMRITSIFPYSIGCEEYNVQLKFKKFPSGYYSMLKTMVRFSSVTKLSNKNEFTLMELLAFFVVLSVLNFSIQLN